MKDDLRESLSALMDNEGDELELRRALKALDGSPGDAEAWRRYHLARSLMHRDRGIDVSTDLCAGIMARIEAEPLPHVSDDVASRRHVSLPFGGGAAIAAAVSLMVIGGVQFYNSAGSSAVPDVASGIATTGSSPELASSNAQPVSAANAELPEITRPAANLPLFQTPVGDGLMAVGMGSDVPLFMAPNQSQSPRAEVEQARLLQSYLERHAEGSAYRSGESWMPLLRVSAQEPLSQR
ncbi:sigma-E factor negative regulatory protein RseA [Modicisalibacter muralis]|uniref:Sigma-E factor negative regulatory protein RseA n=1 Tax=Modicisalibacter muralis TaxID=119000 RepID=A0A1G9M9N4_9GAMM|nr:sigma-E factor negative regulatory protein [Halomonas muralis]SDL70813.1 sigma-E factor negative regulatory protein RseA [Halomonas muralis]